MTDFVSTFVFPHSRDALVPAANGARLSKPVLGTIWHLLSDLIPIQFPHFISFPHSQCRDSETEGPGSWLLARREGGGGRTVSVFGHFVCLDLFESPLEPAETDSNFLSLSFFVCLYQACSLERCVPTWQTRDARAMFAKRPPFLERMRCSADDTCRHAFRACALRHWFESCCQVLALWQEFKGQQTFADTKALKALLLILTACWLLSSDVSCE